MATKHRPHDSEGYLRLRGLRCPRSEGPHRGVVIGTQSCVCEEKGPLIEPFAAKVATRKFAGFGDLLRYFWEENVAILSGSRNNAEQIERSTADDHSMEVKSALFEITVERVNNVVRMPSRNRRRRAAGGSSAGRGAGPC